MADLSCDYLSRDICVLMERYGTRFGLDGTNFDCHSFPQDCELFYLVKNEGEDILDPRPIELLKNLLNSKIKERK